MGYTHYWNNREFTADEWKAATKAARTITRRARAAGIKLRGWSGKGRVTINDDEISFNGCEDAGEDFETFRIKRMGERFSFCKTGQHPYDAAAVAVLAAAAGTGALSWRSDGDAPDHAAGLALAQGFAVKPATEER